MVPSLRIGSPCNVVHATPLITREQPILHHTYIHFWDSSCLSRVSACLSAWPSSEASRQCAFLFRLPSLLIPAPRPLLSFHSHPRPAPAPRLPAGKALQAPWRQDNAWRVGQSLRHGSGRPGFEADTTASAQPARDEPTHAASASGCHAPYCFSMGFSLRRRARHAKECRIFI